MAARSRTVISQEPIRYLQANVVKRVLLAVGDSQAKDDLLSQVSSSPKSETGFGFQRAWVVAEIDMTLRPGAFRSTRLNMRQAIHAGGPSFE